jgi:cupin 2 domain-containing protein
VRNLLTDVPSYVRDEIIETLAEGAGVRIERILSRGHHSPEGVWYDQPEREWVVLIQGAARLRFDDGVEEMAAGDVVHIDAHRRHRVEWTDPDKLTIWLAVYYAGVPTRG